MSDADQSAQIRAAAQSLAAQMVMEMRAPTFGDHFLKWAPLVLSLGTLAYVAGDVTRQVTHNTETIRDDRKANEEMRRELNTIAKAVVRIDTRLETLIGAEPPR